MLIWLNSILPFRAPIIPIADVKYGPVRTEHGETNEKKTSHDKYRTTVFSLINAPGAKA